MDCGRVAGTGTAGSSALPAWAVSGQDVLENTCAACHVQRPDGGWERIDAARKTPEGWDMTVTRMMRNHGVALTPEERAAVVRYLADTRGLTVAETEGRRYILEREPVAVDTAAHADAAAGFEILRRRERQSATARFLHDGLCERMFAAGIQAGETIKDPASLYVWDMELEDASGRVVPLYYGDCKVFLEVTRA